MKDVTTGKTSGPKRPAGGTDWDKLHSMSDAAVRQGIDDDPNAHATDTAFWQDAKVVLPSRKAIVTMRLDADLLGWFRRQRGYQTRINAILRTYMKAQSESVK